MMVVVVVIVVIVVIVVVVVMVVVVVIVVVMIVGGDGVGGSDSGRVVAGASRPVGFSAGRKRPKKEHPSVLPAKDSPDRRMPLPHLTALPRGADVARIRVGWVYIHIFNPVYPYSL